MLSEKLLDLLSKQITDEYYAAYLYLAMSATADKIGLKGTSKWLFAQAQEEMAHGTRIFQYVLERGETPSLGTIAMPPASYANINEIFEEVLAHEQKVTKAINTIATVAMQEFDHACYQFMMWFVDEQVEEISSVSDVLDKINMIGDHKAMLLALDNELGQRVFVHPFPEQA
ncbi:MAG: ferritin [Defluviitaleaceae bacterium]|nr:ferritin [Defluviitaleaceae bacterium]